MICKAEGVVDAPRRVRLVGFAMDGDAWVVFNCLLWVGFSAE